MSGPVRVAMTETVNAFASMPETHDRLGELKDRLDEVRVANLDHHTELTREAAKHGARLIGFGELFAGPFFALTRDSMWFELAEDPENGPTISRLREVARDHSIIISAPIYERVSDTQRFNTTVLIDEGGELLGKYRKCHLPEGSNEKGSFFEPFYYDKSDGNNGSWPANVSKNPFFPVYQTSIGKVGLTTCYDRHFPGVMQTMGSEGAELVTSPAVTFGEKSRRMWHMEFQVDAMRHNLFIAGSNRRGSESPWNQEFFGESHFAGPNGVVAKLSGTRPELVIADLDLGELSRPDPSGWNIARDLRPETYSKS